MNAENIEVSGITLTHPQKIIYPEQGTTKSDLAKYYLRVAPFMIPDLKNRPVSLVRCPGGRTKQSFFQKHPDAHMAEELRTVKLENGDYVIIEDGKDLVFLVQMNVLEIHCRGATYPKIKFADRIVFDLDPDPAVRPAEVIQAAKLLRNLFEDLGLKSFVRTSGGKGLHVVIPIKPNYSWEVVKSFSKSVADAVVGSDPDAFIATASKAKRKNKIFIDYLRNSEEATSIANYSTRAREGAPVAVPLDWKELNGRLRFDQFNVRNLFRRLGAGFKDPWAGFYELKQKLPTT